MNRLDNPYAAPTETQYGTEWAEVQTAVVPAGQWLRLGNFVLDYIGYTICSFALGMTIAIVGGEEGLAMIEGVPEFMLGVGIYFFYYFVMEAATGRTFGKFITGTKVVDADGNPPTLGQVAGRTLCRMIPFEPLSFCGTPARGWHDSIPKTYVIKSE